MTRLGTLVLLAIVLPFVLGAGCLQGQNPGATNTTSDARYALMKQQLRAVTGSIQGDLDTLDTSLARNASVLGSAGLSGPEADRVLAGLAAGHPEVLSAITVDPTGTVLATAPESARAVLGRTIANQDAIARVLSTREPVMGKYFTLRQGGAGVAIVRPVLSPAGEFVGAVSLTFSPQALVAPLANASKAQAPVSFIVAQPDGVLLYHANATLSGTSTFDEPVFQRFPEVLDLARRYGAERTGYATFSFYREGDTEVVRKETFWETVSLHDTEWRVLVVAEAT
jgi:hypothetical protein